MSRKGLCERDNLDSSQQLACPTRRLWSQQAPTGSHEDQIPKGCPGPSETLNADRCIAPDIAGQGWGLCDWDNLNSWQQLTCPTRRLWSQQAPTGSHEDQIPERCPGPSETLKADSCIAPEVAGQGWGLCDWENLDSWQQLTCPARRLWSQQAPTGSHEDQIPKGAQARVRALFTLLPPCPGRFGPASSFARVPAWRCLLVCCSPASPPRGDTLGHPERSACATRTSWALTCPERA